jgi:mannose-6-phosphate isomerase-like protein (cupin superfamily)
VAKVNLAQKFGLIKEYWSPKIAGQLNGQYVKLAKFKGEFLWHLHEREDELFLVTKGTLRSSSGTGMWRSVKASS